MSRHQRIRLRNGIRLTIDLDRVVQHTLFWQDGDMESQAEWAVREFLPVGGVCVDCGANCGYIGLYARRMRTARVVFVEPHPELAATVRQNLALNGWEADCTVVEAAASDSEGVATLYENLDYDGSHSLVADWAGAQHSVRRVQVPVTSLPRVFASLNLPRIDFLKVDTEGHDVAVLRGLGSELRPERIQVLYVELGREREEGIRILQSAGYEGFIYVPRRSREIHRLLAGYREDRPMMLYSPISEPVSAPGETLWLGVGSPEAQHMHALIELVKRVG